MRAILAAAMMAALTVVNPLPDDGAAVREPATAALLRLDVAVDDHPDQLGYSYIDRGTGEVVVRYATPAGRDLADRLVRGLAVPGRIEPANASVARLTQVKDELIEMGRTGVPDARTMWRLEPDGEQNRIIVSVTRESDVLDRAIVARFGRGTVSVRVDPNPRTVVLTSRKFDGIPFSGGALAVNPAGNACSLGFAWTVGFITAGHCAPKGGTFASPLSAWLGTVAATQEENFDRGYGTTYLPGQHTYRGDLALIRSPYAQPRIYRGGPDGVSVAPVETMWNRRATAGDQFCTGGERSGELCGWTVRSTQISILTDFWHWEWVNNVVEGDRVGQGCLLPGDSGGPVYTVQGDGGIAAKGVISSSGDDGGRCWGYFTDIWDAYYGLPGALATG